MILFNSEYRQAVNGYYKNHMRWFDYFKLLLSNPKIKYINCPIIKNQKKRMLINKKDVMSKNEAISILIKPTNSVIKRKHKINRYLEKNDYTINEVFVVKDVPLLMEKIYFNSNHISKNIVSLYNTDPILCGRYAQVMIVSKCKSVDLIELKNKIRSIIGFDFYLLKNDNNEKIIGLNAIHIPDSCNMEKETDIMREYRYEHKS